MPPTSTALHTRRRRSGAEALAPAQTNSHRGGADSHRPGAGFACAGAGAGSGRGAGRAAGGSGTAQAGRRLRDSAISLAYIYFCRAVFCAAGRESGKRQAVTLHRNLCLRRGICRGHGAVCFSVLSACGGSTSVARFPRRWFRRLLLDMWPCRWGFWCSSASSGRERFCCCICCCWCGQETSSLILWDVARPASDVAAHQP